MGRLEVPSGPSAPVRYPDRSGRRSRPRWRRIAGWEFVPMRLAVERVAVVDVSDRIKQDKVVAVRRQVT